MKTGSIFAIILFTLVAIAHLLRLIDGTEIIVDGTTVPVWISAVGVAVPGLIAWLLWKESKS